MCGCVCGWVYVACVSVCGCVSVCVCMYGLVCVCYSVTNGKPLQVAAHRSSM